MSGVVQAAIGDWRAPVEGLEQNLEAALVGHGELADDDGCARGTLQPSLDEVRQQPAAGKFGIEVSNLEPRTMNCTFRVGPGVQA